MFNWYERKINKMHEAIREAKEDPRIVELSAMIAKLQQEREELIDKIAEDIYEKKYRS